MSDLFIDVKNLSKKYDGKYALKNLSLSLQKGDVLAFLGPNGAGKTTTMKMITGFIKPDSGSIEVCRHDVLDSPIDVKKSIGYVPEGSALYDDMFVVDFLDFSAKARGIDKQDIKSSIADVVKKLNLQEVVLKKIETLSKGFKKRVAIASAIIHNPPVLILDEPTDGLDPNQKEEIRNLISEIKKDKSIIISTHILEEAEELCNRVVILNKGEKVTDSNWQDLIKEHKNDFDIELSISCEHIKSFEDICKEKNISIKIIDGNNSSNIKAYANLNSTVDEFIDILSSNDIEFNNLVFRKIDLDNIFKNLTSNKEITNV